MYKLPVTGIVEVEGPVAADDPIGCCALGGGCWAFVVVVPLLFITVRGVNLTPIKIKKKIYFNKNCQSILENLLEKIILPMIPAELLFACEFIPLNRLL